MLRLSRSLSVLVVAGLALSAGFSPYANAQDDAQSDLFTYRLAMEQLRAGRPRNAQVLLEQAREGGPLAPENALLLAYLEDAGGQSESARQTLSALDTPSPLAGAFLRRLGEGTPAPVELKARTSNANPARLAATDARLSKLEALMLGLVNEERTKRGLAPLENDPRLAEVARAHSAEMRDKNYFEHESPTPALRLPMDRYQLGYGGTPRIIAENLYTIAHGRSYLTAQDTRNAHKALMDSTKHRENILLPEVTRIGIGFCTDSTGDLWVTQMFSLRD